MRPVEPRYHVSPSANRDSIHRFGLDWRRMHPAQRGIASGWLGRPEAEGIFLTDPSLHDVRFFVRMGRGRSVDVWRVDVRDLPLDDLGDEGGWWICRQPIPPERLELVEVWETEPGFGEGRRVPLPRRRSARPRI
jgi:hypothetical protein